MSYRLLATSADVSFDDSLVSSTGTTYEEGEDDDRMGATAAGGAAISGHLTALGDGEYHPTALTASSLHIAGSTHSGAGHASSTGGVSEENQYDVELRDACSKGDEREVRRLIRTVASIHAQNINGSRPIHFACFAGHLNVVKLLYEEASADITVRNKNGFTPLHFACDQKHVELIEWLVSHGADLQSRSNDAYTPLHYICVRGLSSLLDSFLSTANGKHHSPRRPNKSNSDLAPTTAFDVPLDTNTSDLKGLTLLHCAAQEGHLEVAKILLRYPTTLVDPLDYRLRSPLHLACASGHMAFAQFLIESNNANINCEDIDGFTPLLYACLNSNYELVRWLVAHGANLEHANRRGNGALHLASQSGHVLLTSWLIECGLKIDQKNNDEHTAIDFANASGHADLALALEKKLQEVNEMKRSSLEQIMKLLAAVSCGNLSEVKRLLAVGADMQYRTDDTDESWLHIACSAGHEDVVNFFISAGLDLTASDKRGHTPFHNCCANGHLSIAKILILLLPTMAVHQRAKDGSTALHLSARHGHLKLLKWLVTQGLDLHATKHNGYSVIHEACEGGFPSIVKYAIKQGADVKAKVSNGKAPVHILVERENEELLQWICTEQNANIDAVDDEGYTPFLCACRDGKIQTAKMVVNTLRANTAVVTNNGETALHLACQDGQFTMCKWLVEIGINIYTKSNLGQTAIDVAISTDNIDIAHYLLTCAPQYLKEIFLGSKPNPLLETALLSGDYENAATILNLSFKDSSVVNLGKIPLNTTPLHFSALAGNLEFTRYLVNALRLDINASTDVCNMTPLHYAAYEGRLAIVQFLVHQGASLTVENLAGDVPHQLAHRANHGTVSSWLKDQLLEMTQSEKNLSSVIGLSLSCASAVPTPKYRDKNVDNNIVDREEIFVEKNIAGSSSIRVSNNSAPAPSLLFACLPSSSQNFQKLQLDDFELIGKSHQVLTSSSLDESNLQIHLSADVMSFLDACESQDAVVIQELIEKGIDVNVQNPFKNSFCPLHYACTSGNMGMLKSILAQKPKLNLKNSLGSTPLHLAVELQSSDIAYELIKSGADMSVRDKSGETVLHKMCKFGMLPLIQQIIDLPRSILRLLDLDMKTDKGVSLLHTAVENGYVDIAKLLLQQSVQVNPRDDENRTPLHYACIKAYYDISELLISFGAFINARDNRGNTPLLCATVARHFALIKLLHQNGANLKADDESGNTALHIACQAGDTDVAKWLVASGLNPTVVNNAGATAAQFASAAGNNELFEWLLAWTLASTVGGTVEDVLAETNAAKAVEVEYADENDDVDGDEELDVQDGAEGEDVDESDDDDEADEWDNPL